MSEITLLSNDGGSFVVPVEIINISELILNGMDTMDEDNKEFMLPLIDMPTLDTIVTFLKKYHESPMAEIPKPFTNSLIKIVGDWYDNFIKNLIDRNQKDKFERLNKVLIAADYMSIQPLMVICCAALSIELRDKTSIKSIIEHFNIEVGDDFVEPPLKEVYDKYKTEYEEMCKNTNINTNTNSDDNEMVY